MHSLNYEDLDLNRRIVGTGDEHLFTLIYGPIEFPYITRNGWKVELTEAAENLGIAPIDRGFISLEAAQYACLIEFCEYMEG